VSIEKLEKIKEEIKQSNDARIEKETQGMVAAACFTLMLVVCTILIVIGAFK
tara:strand:+ start:98 stop:253 length:156 start_codon:yes stop_codon:yes gene_type:complete